MKILGIILVVLMLSLSAVLGVLTTNKSFKLGDDIAAVTEGMSEAQIEAVSSALPSVGRLKGGAVLSILGALAAIGLLVVSFVKKPAITIAAAATVGLCALAIFVYPDVPTGPMDGAAPRSQAMIAAGMALVGAAGAFLVKKASDARG